MQAGGVAPLALERLIFDQLEAAIDPNAAQSFRRIEQGARRDYGQRFFWKPDKPAAARWPLFTPPRWSLFTPPLTLVQIAPAGGDQVPPAGGLEIVNRILGKVDEIARCHEWLSIRDQATMSQFGPVFKAMPCPRPTIRRPPQPVLAGIAAGSPGPSAVLRD